MCLHGLWLEIGVPLTKHRRVLTLGERRHHRSDHASRAAAACTTCAALHSRTHTSCPPSPWLPKRSRHRVLELNEDHHRRFDLASCAVMPPSTPPCTGAHTSCPLSPWRHASMRCWPPPCPYVLGWKQRRNQRLQPWGSSPLDSKEAEVRARVAEQATRKR